MSNLPSSSRYLQRADEAVEEIEREALAQRVSDAYADGRLEVESYRQSMDVIYGASTLGGVGACDKSNSQLPPSTTPEIVGKGTLPAGQTGAPATLARIVWPAVGIVAGIVVLLILVAVIGALLWIL